MKKRKQKLSLENALLAGLSQGILFDAAPKVAARRDQLLGSENSYKEDRDQYQREYKELEEAYPISTLLGNMGGAIAVGLITGGASNLVAAGRAGKSAQKVAKIAKEFVKRRGGLTKSIGAGAAYGGVSGAASKNYDSPNGVNAREVIGNAISGAGSGAMYGTIGYPIGKAAGYVGGKAIDRFAESEIADKAKKILNINQRGGEKLGPEEVEHARKLMKLAEETGVPLTVGDMLPAGNKYRLDEMAASRGADWFLPSERSKAQRLMENKKAGFKKYMDEKFPEANAQDVSSVADSFVDKKMQQRDTANELYDAAKKAAEERNVAVPMELVDSFLEKAKILLNKEMIDEDSAKEAFKMLEKLKNKVEKESVFGDNEAYGPAYNSVEAWNRLLKKKVRELSMNKPESIDLFALKSLKPLFREEVQTPLAGVFKPLKDADAAYAKYKDYMPRVKYEEGRKYLSELINRSMYSREHKANEKIAEKIAGGQNLRTADANVMDALSEHVGPEDLDVIKRYVKSNIISPLKREEAGVAGFSANLRNLNSNKTYRDKILSPEDMDNLKNLQAIAYEGFGQKVNKLNPSGTSENLIQGSKVSKYIHGLKGDRIKGPKELEDVLSSTGGSYYTPFALMKTFKEPEESIENEGYADKDSILIEKLMNLPQEKRDAFVSSLSPDQKQHLIRVTTRYKQ